MIPWRSVLAPLDGVSLALQIVLILLLAGTLLRRASSARGAVSSTLMLYGLGVLLLIGANLLAYFGWAQAGVAGLRSAILVMGIGLIRMTGLFLFRVILPWLHFAPPSILEDLLIFVAYLVWGMYRLSEIGVDLGSILTTSAVITAIVAFSLQDTLGNILGGVALQLENSISVGDWIAVDDVVGRIVDIRWRSTQVETRDWETVVIPNSILMKGKFSILGRRVGEPVQWRRWVNFNVAFSVSPQQVIALVQEALSRARIPNVARRPAPDCITKGIDGSVAHYAVRYWLTDLAVDDPTDSAVRSRIHAAFRRANIRFAYPESTLHLVSEDEKRAARSAKRELEQRVRILRSVPIFSALSDEERSALAPSLVYAPFVAGDTITEQDTEAHWLYVLIRGQVEVVLEAEQGGRHRIGVISADGGGNFFGEMGLLTGAKRAATVVALSDTECYRLDKPALQALIKARPSIADEISRVMAERHADLASAHDQLADAQRRQMVKQQQREMLRGIRRFFHLDGS